MDRPSIPCCISALIFIINVIVAYKYGYYLYSALFAALIITSLIHHSTKTPTTYLIDKIFVYAIVLYGGYIFFDKIIRKGIDNINLLYSAIIVVTFLGTIVLYYYGHATNSFCFAKDPDESDRWHQLMHVITSIGHYLIVIL